MRHILVPTDFSDCATWAAQTAIEIAKLSGGEVHFLHYMSIPINWIQMEQDQEKLYPDVTEDVKHANSELMRLLSMAEK
ncbi:MAG: universal stress protein, partial [Cyclobacteriaceae bacterium]|nr:universal stress protein [Cyclobacteriaceae bacterium]